MRDFSNNWEIPRVLMVMNERAKWVRPESMTKEELVEVVRSLSQQLDGAMSQWRTVIRSLDWVNRDVPPPFAFSVREEAEEK